MINVPLYLFFFPRSSLTLSLRQKLPTFDFALCENTKIVQLERTDKEVSFEW